MPAEKRWIVLTPDGRHVSIGRYTILRRLRSKRLRGSCVRLTLADGSP
jgi:hypothetical protein